MIIRLFLAVLFIAFKALALDLGQAYSASPTPSMQEFLKGLEDEKYERALSPTGKYIDSKKLTEILAHLDTENAEPQGHPYKKITKMITIDRYDRDACREIIFDLTRSGLKASDFRDPNEFCDVPTVQQRYVTIYKTGDYDDTHRVEVRKDMIKKLSDTADLSTVDNQMRGTILVGAGMLLVLAALPEGNTHWESHRFKSPGSSYLENIQSGPVRDKDNDFFNYVLHPYAGAAYYMQLRTKGYSPLQSFGYSVFMSTVFWEYGWEAVVEKPSKQDLVNTPVLGSLLGELFFRSYKAIERSDGKVLGSEALGKAVMFFLNPIGEIAKKINYLMGKKILKNAETFFGAGSTKDPLTGKVQNYPAVYLRLQW